MNNPLRQTYHLEPAYGLLNDPVGLNYFEGKYHVFFQWNSRAKDHTSKEWGHFSSPDLIHWTWHESPLKPGQEYDRDGVYSGSSICHDGKLFAYYTGNRKEAGSRIAKQCLAVSSDGIHFEKAGPVLESPDFVTDHFRDPRVLQSPAGMIMYIGAQNLQKEGMILNYSSADGKKWEYEGIAGLSKEANMIECPDLVSQSENDILLYCLQNRDPQTDECLESQSVYRVLPKGWKTPLDLDAAWKKLDAGFDSFAAQSLAEPGGRYLLFAWMNRLDPDQEKQMADAGESIHCLSLPRELSVENGMLIQKPAAQVRSIFSRSPLPPLDLPFLKGRSWMAEFEAGAKPFTIAINHKEIQLDWSPGDHLFTIFRWDWSKNEWEERSVQLRTLSHLQIFMDTSSIEVFLNHGEEVLSARVFPTGKDTTIRCHGIHGGQIQIYPAVPGHFRLEKTFE